MASTPLFADRVLQASTTTGTGTLTLGSAIAGYQAWSVVGDGNSGQYYIEAVDANGVPTGDWELGIGTYTSSGTTLSRTFILSSSNSGSAVSLSSGTKRVGLVAPVAAASVPVNSDWGGRLTLETGVPVSTTDQLAKGHLFYTPYLHNRTPKWNGSGWERVIFTEYDLTLSVTSGKNYDVFWNGSALSLSSAWTNDTTRADALSTQDGVQCLGSDKTKLLVGTIRASGTNLCADSGGGAGTTQVGATRFVWNRYNQVERSLKVIDTTDSWSYTTNTVRQANGATGNKIEYVTGDIASCISARVHCTVSLSTNVNNAAKIGVGVNATSAFSGIVAGGLNLIAGFIYSALCSEYIGTPGLGYNYLAWCEKGADGNCSFIGDNGGDGQQAGLIGSLIG